MTNSTEPSGAFPETFAELQHLSPRDAADHVYRVYTPILAAILARRLGGPVDSDRVQEILQRFVFEKLLKRGEAGRALLIEQWDQSRGRFRCFLTRSFDNFVYSVLREEQRERARRLDQGSHLEPQADSPLPVTEVLWVHAAYGLALARFEQECAPEDWQLFQERAALSQHDWTKNQPTLEELAARWQLSYGQVAGRLRRLRARFRQVLRAVIREHFCDDPASDQRKELAFAEKVLGSPDYADAMAFLLRELNGREALNEVRNGATEQATHFPSTAGHGGRDSALESAFVGELLTLACDQDGKIAAAVRAMEQPPETLELLLRCFLEPERAVARAKLSELKQLKDAFVANRRGQPRATLEVIYCALTAAAINGYGERALEHFTRNSRERTLANFRKMLRVDGLPTWIRRLVVEALESLEHPGL